VPCWVQRVREYALETLADPDAVLVLDAVLVIDETGFLKQGKSSCGVGRQYTGSAGSPKRGAFAAYVSRHGHAFVDRALHLPKACTDDPARLAAAHVPAEVGFATKPRLARRMVERATTAGVPFAWVAADSVDEVSELEMALRRARKGDHPPLRWTPRLSSCGSGGGDDDEEDTAWVHGRVQARGGSSAPGQRAATDAGGVRAWPGAVGAAALAQPGPWDGAGGARGSAWRRGGRGVGRAGGDPPLAEGA